MLQLSVIPLSSIFFLQMQEEKLEPLKNTTDDPRIRLLNRLYAKKRKELKEKEKLKVSFGCLPSQFQRTVEWICKKKKEEEEVLIDKIHFNYFFYSLLTFCQNVEVEEERVDERSVDDLLSFINGEDGGIFLWDCSVGHFNI